MDTVTVTSRNARYEVILKNGHEEWQGINDRPLGEEVHACAPTTEGLQALARTPDDRAWGSSRLGRSVLGAALELGDDENEKE